MTIKLPMGVEIEMNTCLPYDFDDIIRKIFKEYLGEAKTENLAFDKLNFIPLYCFNSQFKMCGGGSSRYNAQANRIQIKNT